MDQAITYLLSEDTKMPSKCKRKHKRTPSPTGSTSPKESATPVRHELFSGQEVPDMLKPAERRKLLTDHMDIQEHIKLKESISIPLSSGLKNAMDKFDKALSNLDTLRAKKFRSMEALPFLPTPTALAQKYKLHPGQFNQVELKDLQHTKPFNSQRSLRKKTLFCYLVSSRISLTAKCQHCFLS